MGERVNPSDDELPGLRKALAIVEDGWLAHSSRGDAAAALRSYISHVEIVRKDQGGSVVKDNIALGNVAEPHQGGRLATESVPPLQSEPHQNAAQPKAAVGSGGPDLLATLHSSPAAEHCLPAATLDLEQFEGATPGPWTVTITGMRGGFSVRIPESQRHEAGHEGDGVDGYTVSKPTSLLVAKAPDLLAECKKLRATAAPCAEGPSKEEVRVAELLLPQTYIGSYTHLFCHAILRWREQTKGK